MRPCAGIFFGLCPQLYLAPPGVTNVAPVAPTFQRYRHRKFSRFVFTSNRKIMKRVQNQKSFLLHESFLITFQKMFLKYFCFITVLWPKVVKFFMIFSFLSPKSSYQNFIKANWRRKKYMGNVVALKFHFIIIFLIQQNILRGFLKRLNISNIYFY